MTSVKPSDQVFKVLQENKDYNFTVTKSGFFSGRKVVITANGETHTCKIGELFKKLDTEVKKAKNASRAEIQTLMDTREKIARINKSPLSEEIRMRDGMNESFAILHQKPSSDVYGKRTKKIDKLADRLWFLSEKNTTPEERSAMKAQEQARDEKFQANMAAWKKDIENKPNNKIRKQKLRIRIKA